jgi:hypothetical protein
VVATHVVVEPDLFRNNPINPTDPDNPNEFFGAQMPDISPNSPPPSLAGLETEERQLSRVLEMRLSTRTAVMCGKAIEEVIAHDKKLFVCRYESDVLSVCLVRYEGKYGPVCETKGWFE